jgi:hypothetical protein
MNANMNRVRAEEDLRRLHVLNQANGEDPSDFEKALRAEMGEVIRENPLSAKLDVDGLNLLKSMS